MDSSEHQAFLELLKSGFTDADLEETPALADHVLSCELCRDYMTIHAMLRRSTAKRLPSHADTSAAQRRVAQAIHAELDSTPGRRTMSGLLKSVLRVPIALLVGLGMATLTWMSASAIVQPRSVWEALKLPFAEPTSTPVPANETRADQQSIAIFGTSNQLGGAPESLFVSEDLVYVGLKNQLFVFTIANPASPTLLGSKVFQPQSTDPALSIYVLGQTAYVANWAYGMFILDVSDPADVRVLSQFRYKSQPNNPYHLVMVEDIVAVRDDTALLVIDECDSPCTETMIKKNIVAVDVRDPKQPTVLGSYPLTDDFISARLLGDTLLLGDHTGILRIDASDPTAFHELGRWAVPGLVSMLPRNQSIYALIGDAAGHKSLRILDISDASAPSILGETSLVIDWWRPSLDMLGTSLLVYDKGYPLSHGQRIEIIDVMDPTRPTHAASRFDTARVANDASGYVNNDAALADGLILRVGGAGRLEVLRVTQP